MNRASHRKSWATTILCIAIFSWAGTCDPGAPSVPGNRVLTLMNEKRAEAGCAAVRGDQQLRVAADRHSVDMRDNGAHLQAGTDGHTGTDGSRPDQRIRDAGFAPVSRTGEIIYWADGPPDNTPEATVDWWMGSEPHRNILLDCAFTHAGVGLLYPGGVKWFAVVTFGSH